MWEPRRLTTLWASTAGYRDSFMLYFETADGDCCTCLLTAGGPLTSILVPLVSSSFFHDSAVILHYHCWPYLRVLPSCEVKVWKQLKGNLDSLTVRHAVRTGLLEAICFSETSECLRTTQHYSPKDGTLHTHRRRNSNPAQCNPVICLCSHFTIYTRVFVKALKR
jgi:hypothetical protein